MRLAGVGAYAPRYRLSADAVRDALGSFEAPGIESVAVPDADEDAVTMAWEAGRRALDAAALDGADVDAIFLASTTLPTLDESPVPHLAVAFDAPDDVDSRAFTASTAAGGEALATALEYDAGTVLVVAADAPTGAPDDALGHAAGAGAAAVVLTPDGDDVSHAGSATLPFQGTRYRQTGADATTGLGITGYDRVAYTDTLTAALDGVEVGVDAAALSMPDGKRPYRATAACGLDAETVGAAETVSTLGDTGAASPLLGLAQAARDGATSIVLAAYGSGATCHAFEIHAAGAPVEAALDGEWALDYAGAMRRRGAFSTGPPAGGGANVTTPTFRRSLAQRYRLDAGVCRACGDPAFPPDGACPTCGARDGYETVTLPWTGRVATTTEIGAGGAPPEFVDYQQRAGAYGTAIVTFEGEAGAVDVPLQVVGYDDPPEIGDRVSTSLRVLYDQHGSRRYGLKATPPST